MSSGRDASIGSTRTGLDEVVGVRSLVHAVIAAQHVRRGGGRAFVDVGRFGWPATVVLDGSMVRSTRRRAVDAVLAIDPEGEPWCGRRAAGTSVRAQTIRRVAAQEEAR